MLLKKDRIVLFPIDSVSRELEWKLVMVLELTKQNTTSIIGHKQFIMDVNANSHNTIWFGRLGTNSGKNKKDYEVQQSALNNNNKVLYLHDEGGFYSYIDYKSSVRTTHPYSEKHKIGISKILTWGEAQKDALLECQELKEKDIDTVGNPKFDLFYSSYDWLDSKAIQNLQKEFGEFVLITTKFGGANSNEISDGKGIIKKINKYQSFGEANATKMAFNKWRWDKLNFANYVYLIQELANKFPQNNFVVRPHPSEDSEFYKNAFNQFSNIIVIREGDVRPWIKASSLMIHSGCTTGFEGTMANKPVINFMPEYDNDLSRFNIAIASEAGQPVKTIDHCINLVEKALNNQFEEFSSTYSDEAKSMLKNLEKPSMDIVTKLINDVSEEMEHSSKAKIPSKAKSLYRLYKDRYSLQNIKKGRQGEVGRFVRLSDLPKDRIEEIVMLFNKNKEQNAEIKDISKNYVIVGPKK